ncbi:universal stress protein [Halostella sp. JP-L12]|uniref:universal stress protein n=1 Tax=Halostella TaxID=1843185 RepID=UPI000EF84AB8|nr:MULTISPECIES: universal stress protein [Halostella]NHN47167.1 universal stress protein [Halostella sp. JP-L12]
MQYLVGTDSVHTSAAACDYLEPRLADRDEVVAVAVVESGDDAERRDRQEALNVFRVRLPAAAPETALRDGDAAAELLAAADERDADELVVGPHRGDPDLDGAPGGTLVDLLADATRPVAVVPLASSSN